MASGDSKEAILGLLCLPTHFADRTDCGLHVAYQKYKAHLEAFHTYEKIIADGSWSQKKLIAVDFIELFVSKSFWHSCFKPVFSKVSDYPLMVEWLENELEDSVSNQEVWGEEKSSYTFKDLHAWLDKSAGKGKKKMKAATDDGGNERRAGRRMVVVKRGKCKSSNLAR